MKWVVSAIAGVSLAGGLAAAQQQESGEYDPDRNIVSESPQERPVDPNQSIVTDDKLKPEVSMGDSKVDSPLNTEYGVENSSSTKGDEALTTNQGLSKAKADYLEGKKVVTLDGKEIGEIHRVGKSPSHDERVATVDAGGFLGVGSKTIAIPLSKLHQSPSDGDNVRLSMMRTSLEEEPEFDESQLTPDE